MEGSLDIRPRGSARKPEASPAGGLPFEMLIQNSPLGMFLVDADFKIQQINPAALPAFGSIPHLIGRDLVEVTYLMWPQEYAAEIVDRFRRTLETGEPYTAPRIAEERRDRAVTEFYEWSIHRVPLLDGQSGVVCYFRDISASVTAEQRLRDTQADNERQRRLYETILSNTPDLTYVFDLNHRFTYANAVLLRMWGKTWDEAIGKTCLELGYEPWHAEMHDREIEQVIATKAPIRGEVPFAGTFGRRIYDYIFVPVFDADGNVEAIAGTTRDVTERKATELRHSFLVSLDDALRPLIDPQEITLTAARLLGEHFHVDRCAYADIEADEDTMNLTGNYMRRPDIRSIVGRLRFADFGQEVLQLMREDKAYVVHDVDTHQPPVENLAAYRATQIQAVICVPLHKAGRFVAAMAVHMATPRVWSPDEVELLRAVAARCWESIERARLERGLRESEGRFRAFVTASSDVVYRMNADWTVMQQLAGRDFIENTPEPEHNWMEKYIHPADRRMVEAAVETAIRTKGEFQLEHRVFRVDGSLGWTFSRAIPLLDSEGRITEWFGTASDVTENRHAEEALRESEARYRSLFESIDEGFCVIEMLYDDQQRPVDYRFIEVNPAFEKQAGMQDVVGKRMLEFVSSIEEHWLENYDRVVKTGQSNRFAAEYKGLDRWFDVYAFRIGDTGDTRLAVLFNDITERKMAEDVLRASEERARAASAAKDAFLAQLSHELRTPLTPVLMTAATLRDDPSINDHGREAFAMIERFINLEARLIDDLLDITRVTQGKLALRFEVCDIHHILTQAIEIIRDGAREKGITLQADLKARRTAFLGDAARLQQVFWNILQNAVKYSSGGTVVHITTRDTSASHADAAPRGIVIEVSDTGMGFDPAEGEKLFQPFHQADAAKGAGLGLGLAIARAIVEQHSGSIVGTSEGEGCGAKFVVELPTIAPPTGKPRSEPKDQIIHRSLPTRSLRLLLVEDHEATLQVLSRFLTHAGHVVTVARSIREGREIAGQQAFDFVVSDLGLPDGVGTELMKELRDTHGLTGVALSGYGMEEDVRRSRAAGFAAHLVKPVKFEELQSALRALAMEKDESNGA
ncbi:PAS domain-containing protein [Roseimicrobium sp. ORNL1]|uniref:PAS domain-containing protein n=1 Tax=Roseimicrobium sp. ORNL1 TaxID=2711231 RepID=UPI0013E17516|nr:PAS domain-containing protein [Roseimicrobium sp. ORNL1]QIF00213.1 PAS domain-containing protein [Roseimicrobium sp. ORNL1]